ncbi:MAG: sulfatase-like hydrolase/transferase, partial [Candidatus Shapirobacteria bacterium]|nr:sulfatase-like hydrolase/transferase [Candidatus Shapirobacteria bacterium]
KEILKLLNSTDQSQFIFALSMQNHYPFEDDRFPDHKIEIKSSLKDINKKILQTYTEGINLTDESYLILKNELIKIKKPTIVVLFGDHLPLLNSNLDIYKKTNFDIYDQTKMHSTPITVWANFKTNLNLPKEISPSFLSLEILKLANITPKYQFAYLNSISSSSNVLSQSIPLKFNSDQLKKYELVQYDLLFGKQYGIKE